MKKAIFSGERRTYIIDDKKPDFKESEAQIRVKEVGICDSDLYLYISRREYPITS